MVSRVPDPVGDRRGVAKLVRVEDPHGHDRSAVGEAGETEAVVGCFRNYASDESAVPGPVKRIPIARDEVVGLDEAGAPEIW